MKEHSDSYGKIAKELVDAFELYNKSIGTIVEVWEEMLNSSDNNKIFTLLIMTEFYDTIWSDPNINIVIEEILSNIDDLKKYSKTLEELTEINERLDDIVKDYQNNYNNRAGEGYEEDRYSQEEDYSTSDSTCEDEVIGKEKKRNIKSKGKQKNKKAKNNKTKNRK